MSYWCETVPLKPTLTVANNGVSYIFDMTVNGGESPGATPGSSRDWMGGRLRGTVKAETQAVTVRFYLLTDNASASGDWELDTNAPGSGGSLTVAAGSTQPFDWKINGIGRADILNGATGPSDLTVMGLFWEPSMEPGA